MKARQRGDQPSAQNTKQKEVDQLGGQEKISCKRNPHTRLQRDTEKTDRQEEDRRIDTHAQRETGTQAQTDKLERRASKHYERLKCLLHDEVQATSLLCLSILARCPVLKL